MEKIGALPVSIFPAWMLLSVSALSLGGLIDLHPVGTAAISIKEKKRDRRKQFCVASTGGATATTTTTTTTTAATTRRG
jgi:hypothetical protein